MSTEEFRIAVQLLCLTGGPILIYHGIRRISDKKYYMSIADGYIGDNVDEEYEKQKSSYHYSWRYVRGVGAIIIGIMLVALFIRATFYL